MSFYSAPQFLELLIAIYDVTASVMPKKFSHVQFPKFSGDPSELNIFLASFQNYAFINDINDPQLLFEVTQALENPFRQFYAQHNEYDLFTSSKQLFKFLRDHFQSENVSSYK